MSNIKEHQGFMAPQTILQKCDRFPMNSQASGIWERDSRRAPSKVTSSILLPLGFPASEAPNLQGLKSSLCPYLESGNAVS